MEKKVREYARARGMSESLKALKIAKTKHEGQVRSGKDEAPYIIHPLMLACHAIALKVDNDNLISVCLLHDVVEDCDVTLDELDVIKHEYDDYYEAAFLVKYQMKSSLESLKRFV